MKNKKYNLIYCDPPWKYNSRSMNRITKFGGGAMAHYPVMSDKELIAYKATIDEIAADDCIMFMWVTGARNDFGVELMKKWGFKYGTIGFVWNKLNKKSLTDVTCPGFYTSSSCEFVLIGTRGKGHKPAVFPIKQKHDFPRREHSRKPDEFREMIELMYPNHSKIELFARATAPGWDALGNEVGKFDE